MGQIQARDLRDTTCRHEPKMDYYVNKRLHCLLYETGGKKRKGILKVGIVRLSVKRQGLNCS